MTAEDTVPFQAEESILKVATPRSQYNFNFWNSCGDLRNERTDGPTYTYTPRRDECTTSSSWEHHYHHCGDWIRKCTASADTSHGYHGRTHPPNSGAILCDDEVLHWAGTLWAMSFRIYAITLWESDWKYQTDWRFWSCDRVALVE